MLIKSVVILYLTIIPTPVVHGFIVPGPSRTRSKALTVKEIDCTTAGVVLSAIQQKEGKDFASKLDKGENNVKATVKKGDDTFVLKNVESILLESPEERENQKRLPPTTSLIYQKIHWLMNYAL